MVILLADLTISDTKNRLAAAINRQTLQWRAEHLQLIQLAMIRLSVLVKETAPFTYSTLHYSSLKATTIIIIKTKQVQEEKENKSRRKAMEWSSEELQGEKETSQSARQGDLRKCHREEEEMSTVN